MKLEIQNKKIKIFVQNEVSLDDLLELVDRFDAPEWEDYEIVFVGEAPYYYTTYTPYYIWNDSTTTYKNSPSFLTSTGSITLTNK